MNQPAWTQPNGMPVMPVTPARADYSMTHLAPQGSLMRGVPGGHYYPGGAASTLQLPQNPGMIAAKPLPGMTSVMGPTAPVLDRNAPGLIAATRVSTPNQEEEKDVKKDEKVEADSPIQLVGFAPPEEKESETKPSTPTPTSPAAPGLFPVPNQKVTELKTDSSAAPVFKMVNTRKFTLSYEVVDFGATGIDAVEVWMTRDTQTWKKVQAELTPPSTYAIKSDAEGVYGYSLVPRPRSGAGYKSPQPGDHPQVWVTVDHTQPKVELEGVELSLTSKTPSLVVRWKAEDANFGTHPISLHYSEKPEGPWMPLVANLKNDCRVEWPISQSLPRRIYLRVEAIDQAGNVGFANTPNWVRIEQPWPPAKNTAENAPAPLPTPKIIQTQAVETAPPRIRVKK